MHSAEFLTFALVSMLVVVALWRFMGANHWFALLGTTLVVLTAGAFLADRVEDDAHTRIATMMKGFAPTYAKELERLGHWKVDARTAADDPAYLQLIELQKTWLSVNPSVADVYTFRPTGNGDVALIVDSETDYDRNGNYQGDREGRTPIGTVWGAIDGQLEEALAGAVIFSEEIEADDWGEWVSAYAPMRNDAGEIEAVCGVDFDASAWLAAGREARVGAMAQLSFLQLVAVIAFVWASRQRAESERRRRAADELADALERAESSDQAKSEFLAAMSHEIRTPLNGVLGMSEVLMDRELGHEERGIVSTIYESGELLLHVINDILDFSKIEAGRMELEPTHFDLHQVLEASVQLMAATAARKELELTCLVADGVPRQVFGDPHRLRQIVVNLLSNAVKFTDEGEVALSARLQAGVERSDGAAAIEIQVRDTGCGVPEDVGEGIFDPFAQADGSLTRRHGGTGLGLAISRQLATLLGGFLDFTSVEGEGSTFRFRLPLQPTAKAQTSPGMQFPPGKVLLVDDSQTNLDVLEHHVRSLGLEPTTAEDGFQALEIMRESGTRFEAAIIDMMMPGMSGVELTREIRADADLRRVPVILLTSVSMDIVQNERGAEDIDVRLTKPIRRADLADALASVLLPEEAAARRWQPVKPTGRDLTGTRILLAEDNQVNRRVACAMLERMGCVVEAVPDGKEAVDRLETATFDLVFMDCQMPVMDGYEATRTIREREQAQPSRPRACVIALTAHALSQDREKSLECGMDDHLSKPFGSSELRAAIERWVRAPAGNEAEEAEAAAAASVGSASATPVLDTSVLDELVELERGGEEKLVEGVLTDFERVSAELIATAFAGAQSGEAEPLREAAHALKSSAGQIGAPRLSERATEIDLAIKRGDAIDLLEVADALSMELEAAIEELHRWLESIAD